MDISQLPKGAVPDPVDERDFRAEPIMGAISVDWDKPFKLPNPGNEDQGSSLSCVAQAWSYYHIQLNPKDFSRRDIYSQIYLPEGGAYIRDGGLRIVKYGQATRDETPDPKPQTEPAMRSKNGVSLEKEVSDRQVNSFIIGDKSIDSIAGAIQMYKGVVFGVSGNNEGWQDLANPKPPSPNTVNWGHALYAFGYHRHNGMKCIIAKSSWCNTGITEHHIKEDYFNAGMVFNAWTLIPKEQFMFPIRKVKINGAFGVLVDTPNTTVITKAEDEAEWRSYAKADSYGIHTINADGTTDWSVDLEINY